jgi:hypothetical protein
MMLKRILSRVGGCDLDLSSSGPVVDAVMSIRFHRRTTARHVVCLTS